MKNRIKEISFVSCFFILLAGCNQKGAGFTIDKILKNKMAGYQQKEKVKSFRI